MPTEIEQRCFDDGRAVGREEVTTPLVEAIDRAYYAINNIRNAKILADTSNENVHDVYWNALQDAETALRPFVGGEDAKS